MKVRLGFFLVSIILLSFCWVFSSFSGNRSVPRSTFKQPTKEEHTIPNNIAYGKPTVGGFGGKVIKVTNLNLGGAGSLRAALRTAGLRIVVFEVAGVIDLKNTKMSIVDPYLTIAGQTAPSPGITLIRGGIDIKTHDIIIQHIRVRPGDAGHAKKSGFDPDALSSFGGNAYNINIDHCSFTWGIDENLTASGPRIGVGSTSHKITFSNNIIAEGLYQASHSKGIHSMGSLVHDFVQDIAIVGNLYSCNNRRNPLFKAFTKGAVINNVIYNPGLSAIHMNWSQQELANLSYAPQNGKMSVVGNVLLAGANTRKGLALVSGKGDAYLEDNLAFGSNGEKTPMVADEIHVLKQKPSWPDNFKALPSSEVRMYVSIHVGARPNDRDAIDTRIVENFMNLKGRMINSQDEVGGYPQYEPVYRKLNVPTEEVDKWLAKFTAEVE